METRWLRTSGKPYINIKETIGKILWLRIYCKSSISFVSLDNLDSWTETRWLWMPEMTLVNIKEGLARYLSLDLMQEDNLFRAFSNESWRTFFIAEWRLGDFGHQEGPGWRWKELCSTFKSLDILEEAITYLSPKFPPESLGGHSWFLNVD